ncbi:hypothetical protein CHS0354_020011 [Potamilus streckersoni]|uniref:Uncharacterized protein n=1 Tax=Potamilus streckersoni TaxID=2493646 RepID=A0AAE0W437_9BIVA|nr:hypothetical protein CHS0354_020011 [Potamilus streckersoni]
MTELHRYVDENTCEINKNTKDKIINKSIDRIKNSIASSYEEFKALQYDSYAYVNDSFNDSDDDNYNEADSYANSKDKAKAEALEKEFDEFLVDKISRDIDDKIKKITFLRKLKNTLILNMADIIISDSNAIFDKMSGENKHIRVDLDTIKVEGYCIF